MSKKMYTEPEVSIITFNPVDIIATSAEAFDGVWVPIGGQSDNDGFVSAE